MWSDNPLCQFVHGKRMCLTSFSSYNLFHSLSQIVVRFSGPSDLCIVVSEQVEVWQLLGLSYFTPISTDKIQDNLT